MVIQLLPVYSWWLLLSPLTRIFRSASESRLSSTGDAGQLQLEKLTPLKWAGLDTECWGELLGKCAQKCASVWATLGFDKCSICFSDRPQWKTQERRSSACCFGHSSAHESPLSWKWILMLASPFGRFQHGVNTNIWFSSHCVFQRNILVGMRIRCPRQNNAVVSYVQ